MKAADSLRAPRARRIVVPLLAALTLALPGSLVAQESALLGAGCAAPFTGSAQGFSGIGSELARLAEVSGLVPQRARAIVRFEETGAALAACAPRAPALSPLPGLSLRAGPATALAIHNSDYASDRNNGAVWAGRGPSSIVRLGATAAWRGVTLTLAPEIVQYANDEFATRAATGNRHELSHPLYPTIDLFQRPGESGDVRATWGQSSLSLEHFGMIGGVSTGNLWIGPANRYPILLGNTAAGFPHLFFGTDDDDVDVWVGRLQARVIWGRTHESDWFDFNEGNDWSNLVAWGVSLRPRWVEWLEIGAARTYKYRARSSLDLKLAPVIGFLTPSEANRVGDELATIYFRALAPEHAMEFYGEWARTDRYADVENDLLTEPDHSQGYMIGFQKLTPAGPGAVRLLGELVHLQEKSEDRTGAGRPLNVFYTNGQLRQGHTHEGQLLGAWIGPGADAQYLQLDYVWPDGMMAGLFGERVRRNETRGITLRERFPFVHDVELIGGVRFGMPLRGAILGATVAYHDQRNRLFFDERGRNLRFELELGGL